MYVRTFVIDNSDMVYAIIKHNKVQVHIYMYVCSTAYRRV